MGSKKTDKIIDELLNSKSVYEKASKKEEEVWGNVFSNETRDFALEKDQEAEAAQALQLNRDALHLPRVLDDQGISPRIGYRWPVALDEQRDI